jgi:hypothetical protein
MPHYTEEQQARLMALPGALLLLVLAVSVSDPKTRLRDVIEGMDFVQEVKQVYENDDCTSGTHACLSNSFIMSYYTPNNSARFSRKNCAICAGSSFCSAICFRSARTTLHCSLVAR